MHFIIRQLRILFQMYPPKPDDQTSPECALLLPCARVVDADYGMVGVLPQHNVWKRRENGEPFFHNNVVEWKPLWGNKVKVWVGEPVEYQDLIDEYEKQHGPLWKVSPTPTATEEEFRELLDRYAIPDDEYRPSRRRKTQ
jgi:hypothetical protein